MTVIFNPTLYADRAKLIYGLSSGQYTRWGGVIRVTKGYEGAGQIVAFLREVPQLLTPAGAAMKALDIVVNQRGHTVTQELMREGFAVTHDMLQAGFQQTAQQLTQTLAVSSVGAMSSVLNLGVSAIGFYMMNQKLNAVRQDIANLNSSLIEGFDGVNDKLDAISGRLVELKLIALSNQTDLKQVLDDLHQISYDMLMDQLATITIAVERLHQLPVEDVSARRPYIDDLNRIYMTLGAGLASMAPSQTQDPRRFMTAVLRYRGWSSAGAGLAMAYRAAGQWADASRIGAEMSGTARSLSAQWADVLMPQTELHGVSRFGHTKLRERVPAEVILRLHRAQYGELAQHELEQRTQQGALTNAYGRYTADDQWMDRQLAAANFIDMVEESTERIESLHYQLEYTHQQRIPYKNWEGI